MNKNLFRSLLCASFLFGASVAEEKIQSTSVVSDNQESQEDNTGEDINLVVTAKSSMGFMLSCRDKVTTIEAGSDKSSLKFEVANSLLSLVAKLSFSFKNGKEAVDLAVSDIFTSIKFPYLEVKFGCFDGLFLSRDIKVPAGINTDYMSNVDFSVSSKGNLFSVVFSTDKRDGEEQNDYTYALSLSTGVNSVATSKSSNKSLPLVAVASVSDNLGDAVAIRFAVGLLSVVNSGSDKNLYNLSAVLLLTYEQAVSLYVSYYDNLKSANKNLRTMLLAVSYDESSMPVFGVAMWKLEDNGGVGFKSMNQVIGAAVGYKVFKEMLKVSLCAYYNIAPNSGKNTFATGIRFESEAHS